MENIMITGVSSGIGLAAARYFISKGYFVYGSVRKETEARDLQLQLGDQFFPVVFDVCDQSAVVQGAAVVSNHLAGKGLAALVNNAGVAVAGPMALIPLADLKYQLEVNVLGLVGVTQAFLPLLGAHLPRREKPGKIFNISSISGVFGAPFLGPYCASKYAVEAIGDSWRRELLIYGIDVIAIQPGPIRTPIWQKAIDEANTYPGSDYEAILSSNIKQIRKTEARSIEPVQVARVIYSALLKSRPKTRYLVTRKNLRYWLLFNWVPDRWVDYFIKRAFTRAMTKHQFRK